MEKMKEENKSIDKSNSKEFSTLAMMSFISMILSLFSFFVLPNVYKERVDYWLLLAIFCFLVSLVSAIIVIRSRKQVEGRWLAKTSLVIAIAFLILIFFSCCSQFVKV